MVKATYLILFYIARTHWFHLPNCLLYFDHHSHLSLARCTMDGMEGLKEQTCTNVIVEKFIANFEDIFNVSTPCDVFLSLICLTCFALMAARRKEAGFKMMNISACLSEILLSCMRSLGIAMWHHNSWWMWFELWHGPIPVKRPCIHVHIWH